jgi:hypothetical protein
MLYELMSQYGTNNLNDVFGSKWDSEDPFAEDTSNQNLLAWFSFEETGKWEVYEFSLGRSNPLLLEFESILLSIVIINF